MSNPQHLNLLMEGVEAWNRWRSSDGTRVHADLYGAYLRERNLSGANLSGAYLRKAELGEADLSGADLSGAHLLEARLGRAYLRKAELSGADLSGADLSEAHLLEARLGGAKLRKANLSEAHLAGAKLRKANLSGADLSCGADLSGADLRGAYLSGADLRVVNLRGANLRGADLRVVNLRGANLGGANLMFATLAETNLEGADLTGCHVYGISVWDVNLQGAIQSNLVITHRDQPVIQVDNLEVAQFIYLLLNNERIRHVIDTITSKVVLILGRFTPERKAVLEAIRGQLREKGYLPVLFDFDKPESKDLTGTVTTLANMARFIVADLTDPSSVPHELATVVSGTVVPVQTILLEGQREYAMFVDLQKRYHWVLEPYPYESKELLIADLGKQVIAPAEAKAEELRRK